MSKTQDKLTAVVKQIALEHAREVQQGISYLKDAKLVVAETRFLNKATERGKGPSIVGFLVKADYELDCTDIYASTLAKLAIQMMDEYIEKFQNPTEECMPLKMEVYNKSGFIYGNFEFATIVMLSRDNMAEHKEELKKMFKGKVEKAMFDTKSKPDIVTIRMRLCVPWENPKVQAYETPLAGIPDWTLDIVSDYMKRTGIKEI